MDRDEIITAIIFVWWVGSRLKSARDQRNAKRAAPKPGAAKTAGGAKLADAVLRTLGELDAEVSSILADIPVELRRSVEPTLQGELLGEARRLETSIRKLSANPSAATVPQLALELDTAGKLAATIRRTIAATRTLSFYRAQGEFASAHRIADAVIEEVYPPIESALAASSIPLALGPPIAVIDDGQAMDRLAGSPLAATLIVLEPEVVSEPWRWTGVGTQVGEYITSSLPGLTKEIHLGLDLDTENEELNADSEAMAKLLFASWLRALLSDLIGAQLFGVAHLRALSRRLAVPHAPGRVTRLVVSSTGVVDAQPPAHMRFHITAAWLGSLGFNSRASELRREWDEEHNYPDSLEMTGGYVAGSIPTAPLLAHIQVFLQRLRELTLPSLGDRALQQLPGLTGLETVARGLPRAKRDLERGMRTTASARTLIAAAAEVTIEQPELATEVTMGLERSLAVDRSTATQPAIILEAGARRATGIRSLLRDPRAVAEALVLSEVLLERRTST